ncbi:MAG: Lipid II flippase FtsW [candidate division WS6 bacterium OLB20]|uniref:Probable peptidoglycan glycosyltransferase FtsW n=1 Tax=candidate division WS6 bacterium OLB20 TaxID=1617426 RepID=A0A136LXM0_9BACT|nr:MAG: Lipid II flippase FtsW [candidate division WS6 bacterium OLB20]
MKRRTATAKKRLRLPSFSAGDFDTSLLTVVGILSLFGTIMVYSGSVLVAVRQGNDPSFYFVRQCIWVAAGFVALFVLMRIDYHLLKVAILPLLLITVALLLLVLFVNADQEIKRWIDLGAFDLQPSELAKPALLIYLSILFSKAHKRVGKGVDAFKDHFMSELLPFLLLLGVVGFLIFIQPDLDTTIILAVTSFIVYFIAGNDHIHFIGSIFTAGVLGIAGLIGASLAQYRIERLGTYFDFWRTGTVVDPFHTGYQLRQLLVAVASGGLFGVGFGESRQKFHYLGDTAFSDTIFAIFAEEFGFFGVLVLTGVFVYIMLKGYKIARNAPDKLGFLLAVSITTWLMLQAMLHIAANVALLPINGNTLPFISYGGSSTIVNLAAIGILLNISSQSGAKKRSSRRR